MGPHTTGGQGTGRVDDDRAEPVYRAARGPVAQQLEALGAGGGEDPGGEVHRQVALVEVVVEVGEDPGVPGAQLGCEREKEQVCGGRVQLEGSHELPKAPGGPPPEVLGARHRGVERAVVGARIYLAVSGEQRVHLIVRNRRAPELTLSATGGRLR